MTKDFPAALPIAHVVLRIVIVLNWLFGAGILALLIASLVAGHWTMTALGAPSASDSWPLSIGMRAIMALGLVAIPLNYLVLKRLLAIVETVRSGDPFVAANADRLQAIAWTLLALQLLGLTISALAKGISTSAHPLHLDAGMSISGWLAVLLTFVLARVFARGSQMREDIEGTV